MKISSSLRKTKVRSQDRKCWIKITDSKVELDIGNKKKKVFYNIPNSFLFYYNPISRFNSQRILSNNSNFFLYFSSLYMISSLFYFSACKLDNRTPF